jgi:hypothetical protein
MLPPRTLPTLDIRNGRQKTTTGFRKIYVETNQIDDKNLATVCRINFLNGWGGPGISGAKNKKRP